MAGAMALSQQDGESSRHQMILVTVFAGLYVAFSTALIAYNKFLMHADRFPYAIALVLLHSIFCSLCAGLLFLCKPSLFPSLTDPARKVNVDTSLVVKVAFLQMMKECNIVLVYVFSLVAVLEKFSWRSVGILVFIVIATTMTIHGEVHFSMTGFLIQGTGQLFECCKIVLQAMLLTSAGRKLDALTYVMLVMPLCAILLAVGYGAFTIFPHEHFMTPEWHHLVQWWPHLLGNACIAFALNVVIALFVKHSSAVAFILVGILKDAMIVAAGGIIFKEVITMVQGIGFFLQLCGIMTWSMMKQYPEMFESSVDAKGRILPAKGAYGSTEDKSSA